MKKDKKKWSGSHGAITIFLVIVLIPCLLFTCLFGDLSRVQMSKMTAESAADLTLQALMAKYDPDLKELYGLVASCQNVESFYTEMAGYFTGMMKAEGLPDKSSKLFTSYLQKLKNSGVKTADFLQTDINGKITVGSVENSSLGENPAVLQKSIVEFMKYRGPIEITKNLLTTWSERDENNNLRNDSIKGIALNKEVSDKKQEYAQAEADMLDHLYNCYKAIKAYTDEQSKQPLCPDAQRYEALQKSMETLFVNLELATQLVTMYYFPDSDNLKTIPAPQYTQLPSADEAKDVGKKKEVGEGKDKKTIYCIDSVKLAQLVGGIDTNTVVGKIDAQNASWKAVVDKMPGGIDCNPVVFALEISAVSTEIKEIDKEMDKLLKKYGQLMGAQNCEADPDDTALPADWKTQLSNAANKIKDVFEKNYLKPYQENGKTYSNRVSTAKTKVKDRSYTIKMVNYSGEKTLSDLVKEIHNDVGRIYEKLGEQEKRLTFAIEGDGKIGWFHKTPALDELVKDVENFTTKKDAWGDSAQSQETDYEIQDWNEYNGKDPNGKDIDGKDVELREIALKQIDDQSVMELKDRLVNIRQDIRDCRAAIEAFQYGDKKVAELKDAEIIIKQARTQMPPRSNQSLAQNKTDGTSYFKSLIQPASKDSIYKAPVMNPTPDGNVPDLLDDPPSLYAFMHTRFDGKENEIDGAKKQYDKFKEKSDKKNEEDKEALLKIERKEGDQIGADITNGSGGKPMSVVTSINSLFGVLGDLAQGVDGVKDIRDNVYVAEYIMDMFSHYAFNAEGKERYKYSDEDWKKEDKVKTLENQTLTNTPINLAHNHANRGEIEYILYGTKKGNVSLPDCVKTSVENILEVRMALDTTSGFCLFYNGRNSTAQMISTIAGFIAAASQGVIPVPATKSVMILALAGLEATYDTKTLKAGKPIEFYKTEDTQWKNAFPSLEDFSPNNEKIFPDEFKTNEHTVENGKYYSDYMYAFLLLALEDPGVHDSILNRAGDLIELNMIKAGHEKFNLNNCHTHFQLTGELRVKPIFLSLPLVDNSPETGMKEFREKTDWCTYKLKTIRGYS